MIYYQLREWVKAGDLDSLKKASPSLYTDTLLLTACQYSSKEMVEYLLDYIAVEEMHLDFLFVFREGDKSEIGCLLAWYCKKELLDIFLEKSKFYGEETLQKMILELR